MPETDSFVATLWEWTEIYMHRSMSSFVAYAKTNGFSMSQIGALFRMRDKNMRGVTEIGDELGVTSAAASQMLDRLVNEGLVTRTEDPDDRRVKRLVLTEKGHELLHHGILARQEWMQDLANTLTTAEREQVIAAMRLLIVKAHELQLQRQPTPEA